MLQIDNVKALEEILDRCCDEKEIPECMRKGCNRCEAEYLNEQGAMVRVFGTWISESSLHEIYGYRKCSVCGFDIRDTRKNFRYCPHCGSIMRGVKNGN